MDEVAGTWALGVRGWGSHAGCPSRILTPIPLPAGRSHVMERVLSTMQFLWVLGQALVDGLTRWLYTFTRHHRAMSDVLRAERYLLTQELLRVGATIPRPHHTPATMHCHTALPLCLPHPLLPHTGRTTSLPSLCALQGREVHRGVLDQLYSSEAEAMPTGPSEARDVPSTASR